MAIRQPRRTDKKISLKDSRAISRVADSLQQGVIQFSEGYTIRRQQAGVQQFVPNIKSAVEELKYFKIQSIHWTSPRSASYLTCTLLEDDDDSSTTTTVYMPNDLTSIDTGYSYSELNGYKIRTMDDKIELIYDKYAVGEILTAGLIDNSVYQDLNTAGRCWNYASLEDALGDFTPPGYADDFVVAIDISAGGATLDEKEIILTLKSGTVLTGTFTDNDDYVVNATITGDSTKTLTITMKSGAIITDTFIDNDDYATDLEVTDNGDGTKTIDLTMNSGNVLSDTFTDDSGDFTLPDDNITIPTHVYCKDASGNMGWVELAVFTCPS